MDRRLWHCVNLLGINEQHAVEEARCLLLSVCEYILKHPYKKNCPELSFDDPCLMKLLSVAGAAECLLEVGFSKNVDHLVLSCSTTSLVKLEILQKLLCSSSRKLCTDMEAKKYIVVPANLSESTTQFFTRVVRYYCDIMVHENSDLQQKARKDIPIPQLQIKVVERMRALQKTMKTQFSSSNEIMVTECIENNISVSDLFLLELVNWFKNTYFQWVNRPECEDCKQMCTLESITPSKDIQIYSIEIYKCNTCRKIINIPRYTHPEPLLTYRRGRCGEWANVFTLLCRSLGYDTRLVWDETDHLWTEVWSMTNKRWIHIDPCENAIDQPLMYEKGWRRKLTYVIAFSKDEVQDVTWRYTQDQENVLRRRTLCSEDDLLELLCSLNSQKQASTHCSGARKKYVMERRILELAGMLHMSTKNIISSDDEYSGRCSGSYAWRLARGEISVQRKSETSIVWRIPSNERKFEIKYFIVPDVYEVICSTIKRKYGWQNGVNIADGNVFRKVESDWKVVYLARSPGTVQAIVHWTFEIEDSKLRVNIVNLKAITSIFHGASIFWEVDGCYEEQARENVHISIPDSNNFTTNALKGCIKISVMATLSGGKSHSAWQHAQLFRHSLVGNEEEPSMVLTILLE